MKKQKGFTLIELLIVIAIIGIIAAIAIPNLLNALDRSRQKRSMADVRTWSTALGTYLVDANFYYNAGGPIALDPSQAMYQFFTIKKYLENAPYLDGWNDNFWYRPQGQAGSMPWGYTFESLGKGNTNDASFIKRFKCFGCDISNANGQFIKSPEGPQQDDPSGSANCSATPDCQP